jgi:hypothetical protein
MYRTGERLEVVFLSSFVLLVIDIVIYEAVPFL